MGRLLGVVCVGLKVWFLAGTPRRWRRARRTECRTGLFAFWTPPVDGADAARTRLAARVRVETHKALARSGNPIRDVTAPKTFIRDVAVLDAFWLGWTLSARVFTGRCSIGM